MADEFSSSPGYGPSAPDLAWRIDALRRDLGNVVGRPEYVADKAGTDRRISDLEHDLDELKRSGFARVREVEKHIEDHEKSHQDAGLHWRTLLWTGLLPALASILAVFLTVYLSHR